MPRATPHDNHIPLSHFTRVGLGSAFNNRNWSAENAATGLRTATVILGVVLLAYGARPELFQTWLGRRGRDLDWKTVSGGIVIVAECCRWFFTVVQATRDVYRRWP
ncbi:hypothetical protein F4778DRAFT_754307 [Xylariomycetidae sp. FL2044]|nr:hypothetical protein F4778DRAFT_754307 [Xylariomycetidae sp. FL2044]